MRILLVDDDPISVRLLRSTLETGGHSVVVASNGVDALARLEAGDIRLVISDVEMPGMTGDELCRRIRSGDIRRYVYVILMTCGTGVDVVRCLGAGADDFLHKPVDPTELLMRLRTAQRIVSLETLDMTIFAMARLAEMRDIETGRHVERVSLYSRALARQLAKYPEMSGQVDEEFITLIHQTAALHDIGKVAIPDAVLLKPAQLSPEEFALMKAHTTIGARTLDATIREYPDTPFLLMARDIVLCHHERWDGGGYPQGMRGAEIPLAGRIVGLADVYDALTSVRPYKFPWPHERVREQIRRDAGTHFDPMVVRAFFDVEMEFLRILADYRDEVDQSGMIAA